MVDNFGAALRALRIQRGFNLRELSDLTQYSREHLGNVEHNRRTPSEDLAIACDKALRTGSRLWATWESKGDDVNRREMIALGALAGTGMALTAGSPAQAAAIERSLRTALEQSADPIDWDALIGEFAARHVTDRTPAYLTDLQDQLAAAHYHVSHGSRDATRAAAVLTLYCGLRHGDRGHLNNASGMYALAAQLADRAGDRATRALVLARSASRGIYENWTRARTADTIARALSISTTGAGAAEAHAAQVHLCGLVGDQAGGRVAVQQMRQVAETMPDDVMLPRHMQRVAAFDTYLECRTGSERDAALAYERGERELVDVPLWHADATIYRSWSLVKAGDVAAGIRLALDTVRGLTGGSTRVLGVGVRDVLAQVPAGMRRRDDVTALSLYAAHGPTPWQAR